MTKLEEEILEMMLIQESKDPRDYARMAGIVAKKYIEKAWDDGLITGEVAFEDNQSEEWIKSEKQQWFKENGIVE